MTTGFVLLGTAGAPMPVPGRGGIASALVIDERVFIIDCGRGAPSAFAEAGLDFTRLEAVSLLPPERDAVSDEEWAEGRERVFAGTPLPAATASA